MSYQPGRVRGRGRPYNFRRYRAGRPGSQAMRPQESQYSPPPEDRNISQPDNNYSSDLSIGLDLNEYEKVFFNELKHLWNMLKKSAPVVSKLHVFFNNSENPYVQTLRLLCNCQDFNQAKSKSFPMLIIDEFKSWSRMSRNKIIHLLTIQLKIDVFNITLKQSTHAMTKMLIDVFELTQSCDTFVEIIRGMIKKKQFQEACQYAALLNLHEHFTVEHFLVPLILQDKLFGIDEFLRGSPRHQAELVVFLDNVLGNHSVKETMHEYALTHDIPGLKMDKLNSKPWKKFLTRITKLFKLPSNLTPNLNRRRNAGTLTFLLQKRFIENTFGDESWKEMVEEAVGDEEELQKQLVCQVARYGDLAEALRWAHFYNVDKKDWPYTVRLYEENPDENRVQQKLTQSVDGWGDDEVVQETVEYHKLPLPPNKVHLIDNPAKFEKFLDDGLQDVDLIGVDCEWKPCFGIQLSELALMQIATRKNVFVLDIISLNFHKLSHLWQELGNFVFNNCDILKVGFSLSGDIQMIMDAIPDLNFSTKQEGFLDLCSLWKSIERCPEVKLPYEVQKGGPSLSSLVHHCLGRPLDKSDQFSNWEKRPLRESQISYAALDAFCLIQVYDVLQKCCDKADFPFEETCYNLMTNEKVVKKKAKKGANKKKHASTPKQDAPQPPSPHVQPVPAEELKVVCDTMLQGLGKKLRSCGVDTAILDNSQIHMECVKYALDHRRYILTKGGETFKMLNSYVPSGHCLKIISDDVEEQLREVIEYYKVLITKDHVFSRCQACNGNNFVKVSRSTMSTLLENANSKICAPPPCLYEDEAAGFSSEEDYYDEDVPSVSSGRKWDLYPDEKVDVGLCQTRFGSKIQVTAVPAPVLDKYDFFYVCEECGKVYWDGSHFEKVIQGRLQGVVQ